MNRLVLDYFESTTACFPDKIAFADNEKTITFAELKAAAQRAASGLLKHKQPQTVIAFYTEKSVDTIIGFIAAAYIGCPYTQINLRHPVSRIKDILETIEPSIVVTDQDHFEQWQAMGLQKALCIEALMQTELDETALSAIRERISDVDPLYINFTSGSTGKPKGVVVAHRSVVDFIPCFTELFNITETDVIANQAPFDFDVSVKDIYSGLFTGATVQIVPTAYFVNPTMLMDYLCDHKTTVMIWAVSALCFITSMNALDYRVPDHLRAVLFSGEVMPIKHLKRLQKYLPDVQYVNLYGPTEITCNCAYYIVDRDFNDDESLPIGKPFPNEKLILLDEKDQEVTTPGAVGELCVSGTALALGYYRDLDKTMQCFVQNPNNHNYAELIYKTGDLIRIGEDGEYYYLSRKDFQVKHLGHRIELTEIELAITAIEGVDRACCLFDEKRDRIIAIYSGLTEKKTILTTLQQRLPQYMIPQRFIQIERFPMNKNGKIDRKKLSTEYIGKRGKH